MDRIKNQESGSERTFSKGSFAEARDFQDVDSKTAVEMINRFKSQLEGFREAFSRALLDLRLFDKKDAVRSVVNKLFTPSLRELLHQAQGSTQKTRNELSNQLAIFVKDTTTEDVVFNDVRCQVISACVELAGTDGLLSVKSIMEDIMDKVELAEERFNQIMHMELEDTSEGGVVWGMNLETREVGYFSTSELSDSVVLLGPPTDEAYFTSEELAYATDEYQEVHRSVLSGIHKLLEGEEGVDEGEIAQFLCEIMEYRSQGLLMEYVDLFKEVGIKTAYPVLLNNLTEPDVLARRMAVEVLNELGVVEIKANKMTYLGNEYNLILPQELPEESIQYARRIDYMGSVGFFDHSGRLVGIVPTFGPHETLVTVRAVVADEIFLPKSDESESASLRRVNLCETFTASYDELTEATYQATGVSLSTLNLYEQGLFFSYYAQSTVEEKEKLQKFISHYGELGLHVFLALDYGEKADELFAFTNEHMFPGEQQKELFERLHSLETQVFALRPLLESFQGQDNYPFAVELHEALVRKTAEYLRVALLIVRGEVKDVSLEDLFESMDTVTQGFKVLADLGSPVETFDLVEKPQRQAETSKMNPGELIADARTTWILHHKDSGSRVVITIRPQSTKRVGNRPGGEARVGAVVRFENGETLRVSIDVSDYGQEIGDELKKPVVSLDLGTGPSQKVSGEYPTARVGRLLRALPGSEGGHTEGSFRPESADHFTQTAILVCEALSKRFGLSES